MATTEQANPSTNGGGVAQYDAIVIGAGVSGLCLLYHLRNLGMKVRIFEAGTGVGGTWYWNRYPGCRFDSESYTYGYSFSNELLQEWNWREHFSAQPDTERYLNYVADKFNMRPHIQFNTRITAATFDNKENTWEVQTEQGGRARARYLITAVGILSSPYTPPFEGIDSFKGPKYHTGLWPKQDPDLKGKRVAVIGTGASAVQLIPEIAKIVGHLTVYQRRPNYCAPLRNSVIDDEMQKKIKASYPEIFRRVSETTAAFMHDFDPRSIWDVTPEERLARFEELWQQPGFSKWLANFHDINTDQKANEIYSEFVRNKIRERVKDKAVAEKLVPKDHPFGAKRIPLETNYYEAYNRENVELVDLRENPLERITPKGIKTRDREREFDVIIFATGFDAVTGAIRKIDIRGVNRVSFKEEWAHGPRTYLGVQTAGFPNLFVISAAAFCNLPRCVEMLVEWTTDCIRYMRSRGLTRIEATPEAQAAWVKHSAELAGQSFLTRGDVGGDSWFIGANIPGKDRIFLLYANSAPAYRKECADVAAKGYEGFAMR